MLCDDDRTLWKGRSSQAQQVQGRFRETQTVPAGVCNTDRSLAGSFHSQRSVTQWLLFLGGSCSL